VITLNYSTIAGFYTLQITTAHSKSFQSATVSTSRSLVVASNSGNSSTPPTKSSLHGFPYNSAELKIKVKSNFTAGGLPPISLGVKLLETQDEYCFFQLNTCSYSPYVTSSVTRA
jgi:hypothetical protein